MSPRRLEEVFKTCLQDVSKTCLQDVSKTCLKVVFKNECLGENTIDVKDNTYIDFGKKVNDNDPKSKVGDHVRLSKYKKSFAKGYTPNWSEEVFVIKKIKNTVP